MYYEEVRDPKLRDMFREAEEKGFSGCKDFRDALRLLRDVSWDEATGYLDSSWWAFLFAWQVRKERCPELEPIIMRAGHCAAMYARYVLGHRWLKAEHVILKNPFAAVEYAEGVIRDRWPEAERAILANADAVAWYAWRVIRGRWAEGEKVILRERNSRAAAKYALRVVGGRWPEGESIIELDPYWHSWYEEKLSDTHPLRFHVRWC